MFTLISREINIILRKLTWQRSQQSHAPSQSVCVIKKSNQQRMRFFARAYIPVFLLRFPPLVFASFGKCHWIWCKTTLGRKNNYKIKYTHKHTSAHTHIPTLHDQGRPVRLKTRKSKTRCQTRITLLSHEYIQSIFFLFYYHR